MAKRVSQARRQGTPRPKKVPQRRLIVLVSEEGNVTVQHDGISMTESPTILRMAAQVVERHIGLRE